MKGWGLVEVLIGGVWFVKIGKVITRWFAVCMGYEVEDKLMVMHDETNGHWNYKVWWNMMN
jgi:hypothetical protein